MYFENDHIYHVFNQGNNQQKIYFNEANYWFFMGKMRTYILPFADILAYCLMPNHFHLMLKVIRTEISLASPLNSSDDLESSDELSVVKKRTLNNSIAIMLRSYTRAIQKQEQISGSLFRQKTKAQCLTETSGISPAFFHTHFGALLNQGMEERNYMQVCFDYIHQNPVKAGLVATPDAWIFSSYSTYVIGNSNDVVNKEVAAKEGIVLPYSSDDFKSSDE